MNFTRRTLNALTIVGILSIGLDQTASAGNDAPMEPDRFTGISVLPLAEHPVPDVLKNQARAEIQQMKNQGYVEGTESEVTFLDSAKADKTRLRPIAEVLPKLRITPANLANSILGQATVLGAVPTGGYTDEGWTGLTRIFAVPKFGLVGLEEVDFIASGGGLALIKEAINQDINGSPAILRVKQSHSGKELSQITWTTNQKIYTLSANRAIKTDQSIEKFLALARSIVD